MLAFLSRRCTNNNCEKRFPSVLSDLLQFFNSSDNSFEFFVSQFVHMKDLIHVVNFSIDPNPMNGPSKASIT